MAAIAAGNFKFTEGDQQTIGNVGAQQQAAALMQLSQVLESSGLLRGDEFYVLASSQPIRWIRLAEYMGQIQQRNQKAGQRRAKLTADAFLKPFPARVGKSNGGARLYLRQALIVFSNNREACF